ncbi:hypothetical protein [Streptomyces hebeiensis]
MDRRRTSQDPYAATVWALGLQAPTSYPPETRSLHLASRKLRLWD